MGETERLVAEGGGRRVHLYQVAGPQLRRWAGRWACGHGRSPVPLRYWPLAEPAGPPPTPGPLASPAQGRVTLYVLVVAVVAGDFPVCG